MQIEPFLSERWLSLWQNHVRYDFTETGVHPLFLNELATPDEVREIYETTQLRYIQTNGPPSLKAAICGMYEDVAPENILVTNGSAEANYITLWRLLEPGDQMATMLPNYMQVPGYARSLGVSVTGFNLDPARGWALDLDELERAVTPRTKLIYISNPNNPTGAVLSEAEMDAVVAAAERVGAWILSDEVYRGAELDGEMTPTFWGRYPRTIVVSGLSKAYTLPGLRIGWLLAPAEVATSSWGYHDYTTITTNALSERFAQLAMRPETRARILARNREISSRNLRSLTGWIATRPDVLDFTPPRIGGVAFVGYQLPIGSIELVERLRREKSVLIVPGSAFGTDGHVRIGYGHPQLADGLTLIDEVLEDVAHRHEGVTV